jgi:hypothetical protein
VPTSVDTVQPTEEELTPASTASAWLIPSPEGGMRLIRR